MYIMRNLYQQHPWRTLTRTHGSSGMSDHRETIWAVENKKRTFPQLSHEQCFCIKTSQNRHRNWWYNRRLLFWSTKTLLNAFHWAAHIQDGLCLALPLDYFIDLCLHPWGIVEPWGSIVPQGIPNSTIKWSTIMMKIPVRTYFSQLLGFFPSYLDFWKKKQTTSFFQGGLYIILTSWLVHMLGQIPTSDPSWGSEFVVERQTLRYQED